MNRLLVLMIGLATCTLGWASPVFADCALIDRIDRLHMIQARLARNPDTGLFATDIRQLRAISAGISDRAAVDAVDGNAFTGHGADVVRFLGQTQLLLQRASLDDPQSVRGHFDRQSRENLRRIQGHLTDLRCDQAQIAVDIARATERGASGNSDAEDLAEVEENLTRLADQVFQLRNLLIMVMLGACVWLAAPIVRHRLHLRRRRAKRHNTTYATCYTDDGVKIQGMLIDINCHGTKLRHERDDPPSKGKELEIEIAGNWVAGTVMWSNAHYCGVLFRKSIKLAEVTLVCASPAEAKTQNGAPRDAASQNL